MKMKVKVKTKMKVKAKVMEISIMYQRSYGIFQVNRWLWSCLIVDSIIMPSRIDISWLSLSHSISTSMQSGLCISSTLLYWHNVITCTSSTPDQGIWAPLQSNGFQRLSTDGKWKGLDAICCPPIIPGIVLLWFLSYMYLCRGWILA